MRPLDVVLLSLVVVVVLFGCITGGGCGAGSVSSTSMVVSGGPLTFLKCFH